MATKSIIRDLADDMLQDGEIDRTVHRSMLRRAEVMSNQDLVRVTQGSSGSAGGIRHYGSVSETITRRELRRRQKSGYIIIAVILLLIASLFLLSQWSPGEFSEVIDSSNSSERNTPKLDSLKQQ